MGQYDLTTASIETKCNSDKEAELSLRVQISENSWRPRICHSTGLTHHQSFLCMVLQDSVASVINDSTS